jgi:hypothetical protein
VWRYGLEEDRGAVALPSDQRPPSSLHFGMVLWLLLWLLLLVLSLMLSLMLLLLMLLLLFLFLLFLFLFLLSLVLLLLLLLERISSRLPSVVALALRLPGLAERAHTLGYGALRVRAQLYGLIAVGPVQNHALVVVVCPPHVIDERSG